MKPQRLFPLWRVALFLFLISAGLWFGGVHVRALIGNTLLQPGSLELADDLPPEAEREIFRTLSIASSLIVPAYVVTVLSGAVFLATSPFRLKLHGWLMMSAILVALFIPVEVFTMVLDVRMIYLEFFTVADLPTFRELFRARVGALSGAPFVAQLCYYVVAALAVFRPMQRAAAA